MGKQKQRVLFAALRVLMRPLVRIFIRNGVAYGALADVIRGLFVDVAFEDFQPDDKKQTVSRVSALTGLSRKEVKRLHELDATADEAGQARYNRAVRVISGWVTDKRFLDKNGKPAVLDVEGKRSSFELLVKEYSGDIPTRAMLSTLVEAGNVGLRNNKVRLTRRAFIPGGDDTEKIRILGTDVHELISTIDHNLTSKPENLRFQRKVSYNNVNPDALEKLANLSAKKAQALLEQLDRHYSECELDEDDGRGATISLGIYLFEQASSKE